MSTNALSQFDEQRDPIAWRWVGGAKRIRCPAGGQPVDATETQMRGWSAHAGYDLTLTGCWEHVRTDDIDTEA